MFSLGVQANILNWLSLVSNNYNCLLDKYDTVTDDLITQLISYFKESEQEKNINLN